ncbi:hypothetical protein FB45DRAFT_1052034 [Roridomyces roridus]|uniref:RING-type domain-containing protein n=1 Tax=Roridomyces roridus TaxID=1738132 RepID=A0AAD7CFP6_9AGAR|nr:hypothetical protein FB45DRAFT_1052034 [Roridomyces roridus]
MSTRRNPRTRSRIASSDDDPVIVTSMPVPPPSLKRKKHHLPVPDSEVIEIFSSDDESQPKRKRQPAERPNEQLKQLQQKLDKVQNELERARNENKELKSAAKRSGKAVLDNYDDSISCEICTQIMWMPYILSGCGHAFCQKDLIEWFNTCLAKHMAAHPAWQRTNQPPFHLANARLRADPLIAHMIMQQGPQPEFTCPTCRGPVRNKPVEDFSLKGLIHAVATSAGETSPKPAPVAVKRRGKAKAKAVDGPFDAFFGKDT